MKDSTKNTSENIKQPPSLNSKAIHKALYFYGLEEKIFLRLFI